MESCGWGYPGRAGGGAAITPCGIVLGIRTRAKRDGRGTRTGGAASTKTREDQVAPEELVKLWSDAPWPEPPNGTVGLASATGCSLAAVDFGGGRASTRRMLTLDAPRTMAARTSELGK